MSPIPPGMPPPPAFFSSFSAISETRASVVSMSPAMEAGVLESVAHDLGGVDHAGVHHVHVLARRSVVAVLALELSPVDHDRALFTRVLGDPAWALRSLGR